MKCVRVVISNSLYNEIKKHKEKLIAKEQKKRNGQKKSRITFAFACHSLVKKIK